MAMTISTHFVDRGVNMRKVLGVSALILLATVLAFPQGNSQGKGQAHDDQDDHNDKAPIQSGYGVVTPVAATTGGTTTGLVVFETFGLRSNEGNSGTSQAGVLPPGLTTNAILFVDSSGRLSKNLGVAIVNPNSSNVNVAMTLRKGDGTSLGTTTINVPS